ncbi:hypothetical protein P4S63_03975 [Pseudoalteromonas sp. B193]
MNSKDIQLHGLEALIRWPQADGSFISPEKFISVAERTGLILFYRNGLYKKQLTILENLNCLGSPALFMSTYQRKILKAASFTNL